MKTLEEMDKGELEMEMARLQAAEDARRREREEADLRDQVRRKRAQLGLDEETGK